jgi:hypothetical protein
MTYPMPQNLGSQFSPNPAGPTEEPTNRSDDDLDEAITELNDNYENYERAREYDEIDLWSLMDPSSDRMYCDLASAYDPNFCSVVIDAVNNRMEIASITASDGTAESDSATKVLNEIWDANQLGNYIPKWHRNSLRDGDGYLIAWPSDYEDTAELESAANSGLDTEAGTSSIAPPVVGETPKATAVNITYCDPRMGRMFYDPENPRIKRFFAQRWEVGTKGDKQVRVNLFYPDRIERYISKKGTKGGTATDYEEFIPYSEQVAHDEWLVEMSGIIGEERMQHWEVEGPWPSPNPYGRVPVFHLRTDIEYGKPEHRNAMGPQTAISEMIEMLMVTVRFQGYPQQYALQEAANFGKQSIIDDPLSEDAPSDESFGTESSSLTTIDGASSMGDSDLVAEPGVMQLFKNIREIGQFATADPNVFLDPVREIAKMISTTTDTPLYKFAGVGSQPPSGESLKIIDAPLNKKIRDRGRLFGTEERELFEFALELMGIPDVRVTINWTNPSAVDTVGNWDLVEQMIRAGVPAKFAYMAAGIPEPQAEEWQRINDAKREAAAKTFQSNTAATDSASTTQKEGTQ